MKDVRKHTTVEERKRAYVMEVSLGHKSYAFYGPEDFYWYGQACCAWHARFNGWHAWMRYGRD